MNMPASSIQQLVEQSFLAEINALKPGNVHRYADGHDMQLSDFELSAKLVSPILCDESLAIGKRILKSVEITMEKVGCNTNLGMILLFAPLIIAAKQNKSDLKSLHLSSRLAKVIESLNQDDAEDVFNAIAYANPGGLGKQKQHDVNQKPSISIQKAMEISKTWDRIAYQYTTNFEDLFLLGYQWIRDGIRRWNRLDWAIVLCYLNFLSRYGDSHIARKYGLVSAEIIRKKTVNIARRLGESKAPEAMQDELMKFDSELKAAGINPGTTADLTAASILIYFLLENNF